MKREIKHPDKQVSTGAYSAAIAMDGWLFVSGQGPLDLKTGEVCTGSTFADVVRCGCHLAEINDFDAFNAAYAEFFSGAFPARTTVQSGLSDGIKVEIDCIARLPRRRSSIQRKRR
jgi:2-iminobutanoate/2-iminopropanoate deaminase